MWKSERGTPNSGLNVMETEELITGKVVLRIGGQPLEIEMTVPAKPVKPHRMLPVFQQMTNAIVGLSVNAVKAAGGNISCKAGCGACCRQPVPLAEIEVYRLAELVESMSEPRRTEIKNRFAAANEHFTKMNWYERIREIGSKAKPVGEDYVPTELLDEAMRYFHEGIPCPFLEDESCSIHESRPLACREYLVTSPAENCARPSATNIAKVPLLMNPSRSLRYVGRTGKLAHWGLVPLVRALEFAEEYPESFVEKKGERWAADFFQNLTGTEIPKKGIKPPKPTPHKPRAKKRKK